MNETPTPPGLPAAETLDALEAQLLAALAARGLHVTPLSPQTREAARGYEVRGHGPLRARLALSPKRVWMKLQAPAPNAGPAPAIAGLESTQEPPDEYRLAMLAQFLGHALYEGLPLQPGDAALAAQA